MVEMLSTTILSVHGSYKIVENKLVRPDGSVVDR